VTVEVGPESYARNHPTSMAWVQNDQDSTVSLSPRHVDEPERTAFYTENAGGRGALVAVPAESQGFARVVVHEMGHIAENRHPELLDAVDRAMVRDHGVSASEFVADAMSDAPSPSARDAFFNWSAYGTSDVHEFIAEAFTDGILNESPSGFSVSVMSAFDEVLGGGS
jgi:hypothetical protein